MLAVTSIVLASLAGLPGGDDPPTLEIRIKSGVLARGNDVTIGELADITPVGAEALAIGQIPFGPAPIPGYARAVTRTEILQRLAAAGQRPDRFQFKGAAEALVQAVTVDIAADRLVEEATVVLQAVLHQQGGDVEFEVDNRVRSVQAPPGRISQDLRPRLRGAAAQGSMAVVDVDIVVDGQVNKTVPVTYRLTRYHQVLKVLGSVRAGTPLGPENLALSREKVAQTTGLYLTSFEQVAGAIARRDLQGGRLLMLGDLGAPALIRRGEFVTVVLTRGRVKVTARAIANHDAAINEPVTVTNPESRAQITGIAAAPGTVVVASR